MPFIKLSDGTVAHVRMGNRGAKPTEADIRALEECAKALRVHARAQALMKGCQMPYEQAVELAKSENP